MFDDVGTMVKNCNDGRGISTSTKNFVEKYPENRSFVLQPVRAVNEILVKTKLEGQFWPSSFVLDKGGPNNHEHATAPQTLLKYSLVQNLRSIQNTIVNLREIFYWLSYWSNEFTLTEK